MGRGRVTDHVICSRRVLVMEFFTYVNMIMNAQGKIEKHNYAAQIILDTNRYCR
jgi:hypothetical protein